MGTYQYKPLTDTSVDIRLITLLPGLIGDEIYLQISHERLIRPCGALQQRLDLDELRETLPDDWDAVETLDGRYLFGHYGSTSWNHPDPDVPPSSYQPPPDGPPLGFRPQYEALSYTWGADENPQTAFIPSTDNSAPLSTLSISQNLAGALRHLRHELEPRILWVDAVCINQNDIQERGTQVTRMTDIYRLASKVVVWLGPESEDSNLAISTLDLIGSQVVASKLSTIYASPDATNRDWFRSRTALDFPGRTWQALLEIFKRPWFDRVWIIQEIQLASSMSTVQCGRDMISWNHLRVAILCLSNKVQLPLQELYHRVRLLQELARNLRSASISSLLFIAQSGLCMNPRDKVYGILGLAPERVVSRIRPQYSLAPEVVYRDTFLALMREFDSLNLIVSCSMATRKLAGLPSWVPDWSGPKPLQPLNQCLVAGRSRPEVVFRPPDSLEVSGIRVATVREVKSPAPNDEAEVMFSLRRWAPKDVTPGADLYPTGENLFEAFAEAAMDGLVKERFPRLGWAPTRGEWKATLRMILAGSTDVDTRPLRCLTGRVFITTHAGYFGFGSISTKPGKISPGVSTLRKNSRWKAYQHTYVTMEPGDHICAILGCNHLMILRQMPSPAGYELVGACSLHGFCDGEAVLGPLPKPWAAAVHRPNAGGQMHFHNQETDERTHLDPRLGPLPEQWGEIRPESDVVEEFSLASSFKHRGTGEIMESDPRLLPDALKERGIKVEKFLLI